MILLCSEIDLFQPVCVLVSVLVGKCLVCVVLESKLVVRNLVLESLLLRALKKGVPGNFVLNALVYQCVARKLVCLGWGLDLCIETQTDSKIFYVLEIVVFDMFHILQKTQVYRNFHVQGKHIYYTVLKDHLCWHFDYKCSKDLVLFQH